MKFNFLRYSLINKAANQEKSMNQRKIFTWLFAAILIIAASVFVFMNRNSSQKDSGGNQGGIETAVVDSGRVISGIMTQGIVEPESEVLLLSPAPSVIRKIYKLTGSQVRTGEIILRLDESSVKEQIARMEDQLEMKRNNLEKNRLSSRGIRVDLDYSVEMKKLRIASLNAELEDQEQLLEVGGISPAAIDKTRQEKVIAEKDLQMTLEKNSIRLKQLQAEENGMLLEIKMQERELETAIELLDKMVVRAPSSGIILSVFGKEGERVGQSQTLVRMSDLSQYKITASVEEKNGSMVKTGGIAFAVLDTMKISGQIGNIKPVMENNKLIFDVHMQDNSHDYFKPNQNVNLIIVDGMADSALRVRKGQAFGNQKIQTAYVVKNGKAYKTAIQIGLYGQDYVQIKSGLNAGDRVIISDVSSYRHKDEVDLFADQE